MEKGIKYYELFLEMNEEKLNRYHMIFKNNELCDILYGKKAKISFKNSEDNI